ncbi:MAG: ATP-binding cassette domain-containing protein [Chloroherpetonaceae bacterium]|nr:ATP-binding cassette domain-containing protein [Chthonomonadaceae bacterium]MDW8206939.1 ATP-binding cassette domain-containing protein [Chloroherpetonaceae bacterium]
MARDLTHHKHAEEHPSPTSRLFGLLHEDRNDLIALFIYTIVTGMLALAVPLAAQALVNIIAAGIFFQPLIVLTLIVLFGLLFAGALRLMQLALVEYLQQRIFARTALLLAQRLPRIRNAALSGEYAPELVNRFFDTLTVQKTLAKLLLDGLAALLQALVGLVLLAFYSPLLLSLDLFIILFMLFIFFGLGWNGLRTSIAESVQKYRVAAWLEELARCHISFKMNGHLAYLIARADSIVVQYLIARRRHFRVIFRQAAGSYLFQAIASAATLGVGGYLVINRELTLGQLVAAEIIVVSVLAAMDKLVQQTEQMFDLLTALDKVGHVTDMPVERTGGRLLEPGSAGATVVCRGVRFSYIPGHEILTGLDLTIRSGDRAGLVGVSGAGKSTLAALICGIEEPSHGTIEVNGTDVRDLDLASLRRIVSLVGDTEEIFEGTIEENVTVGRPNITQDDVRWALELAQFTRELESMPEGMRTTLVAGGQNLSRGQRQRLLIARAIVARPKLLIIDESFIAIDEQTRQKLLDAIFAPENPWTILSITHIDEVVMRSNIVHVLCDGKIVESGPPEELARKDNCAFGPIFPFLTRQIISGFGR